MGVHLLRGVRGGSVNSNHFQASAKNWVVTSLHPYLLSLQLVPSTLHRRFHVYSIPISSEERNNTFVLLSSGISYTAGIGIHPAC